MIVATADSNVYISALNFGGLPQQFLTAARSHIFRLTISEPILAEVQAVLRRKFHWREDQLREAVAELGRFTEFAKPVERVNCVEQDPDDDRVLECAIASGSQFIVSGDKHLLQLGEYRGIRILKVAEFLTLIPKAPVSQP